MIFAVFHCVGNWHILRIELNNVSKTLPTEEAQHARPRSMLGPAVNPIQARSLSQLYWRDSGLNPLSVKSSNASSTSAGDPK